MLFHEIYGAYYNVLADILSQAVEGTLTRDSMYDVIRQKGFEESGLSISQNLEDETWPLLIPGFKTPLTHIPTQPLTILQKRWMKTLLQDPRIRLFDPPAEALEDVKPLYPPDALVYFDRYSNGDPFEDPGYITHFRSILRGLREKRWMRVCFTGRDGTPHCWRCIPYRLEYSSKDDKFRLITGNRRTALSINLGRITETEVLEPCAQEDYRPIPMVKHTLVLEVTDERNALERCMLHFSHLEKETERTGEKSYRLTLRYEREDETELLIRVLSFGPLVKVLSPDSFRDKLVKRLQTQLALGAEL